MRADKGSSGYKPFAATRRSIGFRFFNISSSSSTWAGRRLLILLFILTIVLAPTSASAQTSPRAKYNFNAGWKVLVGDPANGQSVGFDDSAWQNVATPYAWNEDDAFKQDIKDLSTGIAWYRKHFQLPAGSQERKIFLEFEGIRHGGEFYLNGRLLGRHENGVMASTLSIVEIEIYEPIKR